MGEPEPAGYSRREQRGWYVYDWANSAFSTTVVTLFLGPYLNEIAKNGADGAGMIHPLGIPVYAPSYWSYMVALSVIMQVITLPLAGAIADYSRSKKALLGWSAYLGAAATVAMFFVHGGRYVLGGLLFLAANLCFGASVVVYNSFLPQIASPADRDAVSSRGWGIGYLGGGLLLALNLLLLERAGALGLTTGQAVRISLASAGTWWAMFSLVPLARLRDREPLRRKAAGEPYLRAAAAHLGQTLRGLGKYPQAATFLVAYLLYNDAIQAVITLATQFGNDELGIPLSTLALAILMVQFVAFVGAMLFDRLARLMGAKRAIMLALALWTGVIIAMYAWVRTTAQFFWAAAVVALVLGGSQALSRSLFSLMIPQGKEAEYFSLYEISDKGTSWMCPLMFGLALQLTGSYRSAMLSLIVFFLLGLIVLARVDVRRGAAAAAAAS